MTFIATINGPNSIWLLADRRLSSGGRPTKDDARKLMFLETVDGVAILGYAGLGATALGTEPADWMSNVLRGRNLPLEQSLLVLTEAMRKQLPRHMRRIPGPGAPVHTVMATAFLNGDVRLYTIDVLFAPNRKEFYYRCTRHLSGGPVARTPQFGLAGSGAYHLKRETRWYRPLLRLVKAYDQNKVSSTAVADHLAALNLAVHKKVTDGTVGPRCIVAWRTKRGSHKEGGGQWYYAGETREDAGLVCLPAITTGLDIRALVEITFPIHLQMFRKSSAGEPADLDEDEIRAAVARLPSNPDENLR